MDFLKKVLYEEVNTGVIFSEGDEWRDQRRLSIQILRNFGMSRTMMQDKIHLVIQDFYDYLDNLEDKDNVDIKKIIQLSVENVINLLLFGFMYSHTDNEEIFKFERSLVRSLNVNNSKEFGLIMLIPSIDKIPFLNNYLYKGIVKNHEEMRELTKIQIDKCRESYNPDDEPQHFIHAVMKEIQTIDSRIQLPQFRSS